SGNFTASERPSACGGSRRGRSCRATHGGGGCRIGRKSTTPPGRRGQTAPQRGPVRRRAAGRRVAVARPGRRDTPVRPCPARGGPPARRSAPCDRDGPNGRQRPEPRGAWQERSENAREASGQRMKSKERPPARPRTTTGGGCVNHAGLCCVSRQGSPVWV